MMTHDGIGLVRIAKHDCINNLSMLFVCLLRTCCRGRRLVAHQTQLGLSFHPAALEYRIPCYVKYRFMQIQITTLRVASVALFYSGHGTVEKPVQVVNVRVCPTARC